MPKPKVERNNRVISNKSFYSRGKVTISLDETVTSKDLHNLVACFENFTAKQAAGGSGTTGIPANLQRTSAFVPMQFFQLPHRDSHDEVHQKSLENIKTFQGLTHSMISWIVYHETQCSHWDDAGFMAGICRLHPFVPAEQGRLPPDLWRAGHLFVWMYRIYGLFICSPIGCPGEYAGLLTIRAYHLDHGNAHRTAVLIPSSAHGTNPASAVMAGMEVVVVACDESGNIDMTDLRAKADQYKDKLAGLMVTYPSTHEYLRPPSWKFVTPSIKMVVWYTWMVPIWMHR